MFERAAREWPKEFERIVLDIAHELQGRLSSDLTPKDTGKLRGSWTVGDIVRKGGEYVIEVYTDVEYATRSTTATARRRVDMSQART